MTMRKGANKPKNAIFLCATKLAVLPASGLTRRLTHRLIEPPKPFITEASRESTMQNLNSPDPNSNLHHWVCGQPGQPPWEAIYSAVVGSILSSSFRINKLIVSACRTAALDLCPICEVRRLALNVARLPELLQKPQPGNFV